MPGPHGGYTEEELKDAGGVSFQANSTAPVVYFYQLPGTTPTYSAGDPNRIEFTRHDYGNGDVEWLPKTSGGATDRQRFDAYMESQTTNSAPTTTTTPPPATQAISTPGGTATGGTANEGQTARAFQATANGTNGQYDANTEQWRSLVAQYFQPQDVDKALWVIQHESGGIPGVYGDNGHSVGLFQLNDRGLANGLDLKTLEDPATNIRLAAQAVYGPQGWTPWGEGSTYNGQAFGALGNFPYQGGQTGATKQSVTPASPPSAPAAVSSPPPPPSPIGTVPASVFPKNSPLLTTATDKGVPVYSGDQARQAGDLTVAARSPGLVSLVSPQGGVGYNPYAVEAGQAGLNVTGANAAGLANFNIPFATEGKGTFSPSPTQMNFTQDYLNNPYDAGNPIEQARLAGVLVKPTPEVSNAFGQSALTSEQPFAHGGGLVITHHSTIWDDVTGKPLATITDSRNNTPETMYNRGGRITIVNHRVPGAQTMGGLQGPPPQMFNSLGIQRFDAGGEIDAGNFQNATGAFNGPDTSATAATAPAVDNSSAGATAATASPAAAPAPVTTTTTPPAASPTDYQSQLMGLSGAPSIPTLPTAPTPPTAGTEALSSGIPNPTANVSKYTNESLPVPTLTNAQAYENAYNTYLGNLDAYNGSIGQQRLNALNSLNSPAAQDEAKTIAGLQRLRDATDYQYAAGGLPKPIELTPPIGTNGTQGGQLGPGIRWALLTPEQQYAAMNSQLSNASTALGEIVAAARAAAEAQHTNFMAAFNTASTKASGTAGGAAGGGLVSPYAAYLASVGGARAPQ